MAATPENMSFDEWVDLLSGPYYGMMWLGLANAAYTSQAKSQRDTLDKDLKTAIESKRYIPDMPLPAQPGSTQYMGFNGQWRLDWGPALSADGSNLVYIASYRLLNYDGMPLFYVVGIRGTDTSAGFDALFNQIFQDLADFKVYSWNEYLTKGVTIKKDDQIGPPPTIISPTFTPDGSIAHGSLDGFHKLATGISTNEETNTATVVTALQKLLKGDKTPIVVTGHSLGGCQTQPMTSYLTWQFPNNPVICHPFAPSTAGNHAFASGNYFQHGSFWWNTLDLVPCAYQAARAPVKPDRPNLDIEWAVEHLWQDYTWPSDSDEDAGKQCPHLPGLDTFILPALKVRGADIVRENFTRPIGNVVDRKIQGTIPTSQHIASVLNLKKPTDKTSMLLWQHFPPSYKERMWADYSSSMVYFDYQSYHHGDPV